MGSFAEIGTSCRERENTETVFDLDLNIALYFFLTLSLLILKEFGFLKEMFQATEIEFFFSLSSV